MMYSIITNNNTYDGPNSESSIPLACKSHASQYIFTRYCPRWRVHPVPVLSHLEDRAFSVTHTSLLRPQACPIYSSHATCHTGSKSRSRRFRSLMASIDVVARPDWPRTPSTRVARDSERDAGILRRETSNSSVASCDAWCACRKT